MIRVNENFLQLKDSYLFSDINRKVKEYTTENPDANIIKLGIGDVTRPIPSAIVDAIKKAADEISPAISISFGINLDFWIFV